MAFGDKYIKTDENGNEAIYEDQGFWETKVCDLTEGAFDSKYNSNILGPDISVEQSGTFSDERDARINGEPGTFKQRYVGDEFTFVPDEEESEREEDPGLYSCSSGEYSSRNSSRYSRTSEEGVEEKKGMGLLGKIIIGVAAVGLAALVIDCLSEDSSSKK